MLRHTTSNIRISGALCGHIWWPVDQMCGMPVNRVLDWHKGDSFEDALKRFLMTHDGDFQNALFTADTVVIIVRRYQTHKDRVVTHTKALNVAALAPDLVDEEHYSGDFE